MNLPDIKAAFRSIKNSLQTMVLRGFITMVKNAEGTQKLQLRTLLGEIADDVEHFQDYGFYSIPLEGAEVLISAVGGSRESSVVIKTNDPRHRPKNGAEGDVVMYNHRGDQIRLTSDGIILEPKEGSFIKSGGAAGKALLQEDLITAISKVLTTGNAIVSVDPPVSYPVVFSKITLFNTEAQASKSTKHMTE